MARINHLVESDDDLPELSKILESSNLASPTTPLKLTNTYKLNNHLPSHSIARAGSIISQKKTSDLARATGKGLGEKRYSKQRSLSPLKHNKINPLLLPASTKPSSYLSTSVGHELGLERSENVRSSPRRRVKVPVCYQRHELDDSPDLLESDQDESLTDLSGFIVPDSSSDGDDSLYSRPRDRGRGKNSRNENANAFKKSSMASPRKISIGAHKGSNLAESTSPVTKPIVLECPESPPGLYSSLRLSDGILRRRESLDLEEPFAKLKLYVFCLVKILATLKPRSSPPRSNTPRKSKTDVRPITPPASPAKSILQSPYKKHRIPPSPHRPSIDAFWSQDVINDWNEQYSPRKPLNSPRKLKLLSLDEDEAELSPSESPRKNRGNSPSKTDQTVIQKRKKFNDNKNGIATSFLAEVDQTITKGRLASMAESTGGIKIIWSKKLSSTAGRANWRREAVRSKGADGTVLIIAHRHHASIELAERVIDDEDRLINVIAHEYCHLANFMISGIKENPHGKDFKEW